MKPMSLNKETVTWLDFKSNQNSSFTHEHPKLKLMLSELMETFLA